MVSKLRRGWGHGEVEFCGFGDSIEGSGVVNGKHSHAGPAGEDMGSVGGKSSLSVVVEISCCFFVNWFLGFIEKSWKSYI